MDNDGKKDLTLGEWYSSIRFYHNSGTNAEPIFTTYVNLVEPDPDSFRNGNPPRIAHADWDGDDDLDMITCDYYGWVTLRENITPSGMAGENRVAQRGRQVSATVVRCVLELADTPATTRRSLFDRTGRLVMDLSAGPNDVRSLPSGVYSIRQQGSRNVHRVIILSD